MLAIDQTTGQECLGEWIHFERHNLSKSNLAEAICNVKEWVFSLTGEKVCKLCIDTVPWRCCNIAGSVGWGRKTNRHKTLETVYTQSICNLEMPNISLNDFGLLTYTCILLEISNMDRLYIDSMETSFIRKMVRTICMSAFFLKHKPTHWRPLNVF